MTAANLELVAQIHKNNPIYQSTTHHPRYNANITMTAVEGLDAICVINDAADEKPTVIPIDHNLMQYQQRLYNKTKDAEDDAMSLASSTHFTMVNGVGGPQRAMKDGLCSRGHQITVLILTMSVMFLIGICAAVFMLECKCQSVFF